MSMSMQMQMQMQMQATCAKSRKRNVTMQYQSSFRGRHVKVPSKKLDLMTGEKFTKMVSLPAVRQSDRSNGWFCRR